MRILLTTALIVLTFIGKAQRVDTFYVPFLNRNIVFENPTFVFVSISSKSFLITRQQPNSFNCFVFKRNKLEAEGTLILEKRDSQWTALRHGRWRNIVKNKTSFDFFHFDKRIIETDSIKTENRNPLIE